MLTFFVLTGCICCFICGLVAGVEMGTRESMKQIERDTDF